MMFLRALIFFFVLTPTVTNAAWWEHYEDGLRELDRGAAAGALQALEAALAERPEPGLKVRTEGLRYVDYTPYIYLAVAAYMTGEVEAARDHLARAEEAGVAARSAEGLRLLEEYRVLLKVESTEVSADDAGSRPSYADYDRQPEVLSEDEFLQIRRRVLARCNLDPGIDPGGAPWYFHYELGLELVKHQDPQRAVDALVEAVARRPDSSQAARMYGMWFIDYLPYFEIAKQHTILGNRECALDALSVSEAHGEVSPKDKRYQDFQNLQKELKSSNIPLKGGMK